MSRGEITVRWEGTAQGICKASEIQLLGSHNLENALAACAIAALAGAGVDALANVATSFSGVEHRLELVEEIEGVRYYDDSIATSPDRTVAALNSFVEPVILLAGGREKHLPLEGLAGLMVRKVKSLIVFGEAASLLEQAVVKAGAVRLVPIFLTQLSTIVGASFMLSDPIFQGLALAMISGIIVSTALTLGVIPVLYYMYLKLVGPENVVEID